MDIDAKDCRLEGFSSGRISRWYRAIHVPTGIMVEIKNGTTVKREAMDKLQAAVDAADVSR